MVHIYRGCTFVLHTVTNSMLCSLDTVNSWLHILCIIGGRKVGNMGLQPHLILFFIIKIFSCLSIRPTWFDYLPPPMLCIYACIRLWVI